MIHADCRDNRVDTEKLSQPDEMNSRELDGLNRYYTEKYHLVGFRELILIKEPPAVRVKYAGATRLEIPRRTNPSDAADLNIIL